MAILKIIFLLLSALLCLQFKWVNSTFVQIDSIGDTDVVATKYLNCFEQHFRLDFKDMSIARFNLIQKPYLHRTRVEQFFLEKSNEDFLNPITLTTMEKLDYQWKNYLIFLTSKDFESLKMSLIPNVHDNSFLYVSYEQRNTSVTPEDILSIFTPSFDQNIVIMMTPPYSSSDSIEWNAFRVVLHKCWNVKEYRMIRLSQCRGADKFIIFPLRSTNTASCPVQVAGILNPPFTYHDESLGFYKGIDYNLIRLLSERLQVPINITFVDFILGALIQKELLWRNSTTHPKNSAYLG